jgi:nucleoside-diphosphate-sugar epimerase
VRAFVTGGTGFVGAHLVAALRARGDAVTALVRSPERATRLGWGPDVGLVRGDLSDAATLTAATGEADVVFHLAGIVSARSPADFFRANRDGTARMLEAAAARPPGRFILVSSVAAAGPNPPGQPHETGEESGPVTEYGRSKLAAEDLVRGSDLPWSILRPPPVYGEWDREFLTLFRAVRFGIAPVFGDGSQQLSMVYAGDLAQALIATAHSAAATGKTYYPTHPEVVTSRDVVLTAGRAVGRTPRVVSLPGGLARGLLGAIAAGARLAGRATVLTPDKANEFFAPAWTFSPAPLTRDTGWAAAVDLEAGFRRTAAWYRERGLL